MRPTFVLNAKRQPVSAIRKIELGHTVAACSPVFFTQPYATPYGTIEAGAKGWVDEVDSGGRLWIKMEGNVPALGHWDNMLLLSPYETEDLEACIVITQPRTLMSYVALAASVAVAFGIGWMIDPPTGAAAAVHAVADVLDWIF